VGGGCRSIPAAVWRKDEVRFIDLKHNKDESKEEAQALMYASESRLASRLLGSVWLYSSF
jgi:hypothetical protein